jgi:F0F1-type ATP synthase assembly protein I
MADFISGVLTGLFIGYVIWHVIPKGRFRGI